MVDWLDKGMSRRIRYVLVRVRGNRIQQRVGSSGSRRLKRIASTLSTVIKLLYPIKLVQQMMEEDDYKTIVKHS